MSVITECEKKTCAMPRRDALKVMIVGGLVMVGALSAEAEDAAEPQWVKAGTVDQFPVGVPTKVLLLPSKKPVFVVHQEGDKWIAVSAVCTHKAGEVEWDPKQELYVCPVHDATYTITGEDPTDPAPDPLLQAKIKLQDKEVQVDAKGLPLPRKRKGGDKGGARREPSTPEATAPIPGTDVLATPAPTPNGEAEGTPTPASTKISPFAPK